MTASLTQILRDKFGWTWKASSLDGLTHAIDIPLDALKVDALTLQHVSRMEALGGVLGGVDLRRGVLNYVRRVLNYVRGC